MADYRREYQMTGDELGALDLSEFLWLLQGLSKNSRFQRAWQDAPKHVYDDADIDAIKAAAKR